MVERKNVMDNYIVINGKKAELTEEQLKKLGIKTEKKRNNPFNSELEDEDSYFLIDEEGVKSSFYDHITDKHRLDNVNSFNDKDFANQVYLHELLNRKLLKYAYENNAKDCEWSGKTLHYYIFNSAEDHIFNVDGNMLMRSQDIYFSKRKVAEQAIEDVIKPFMKEYPDFVW